MRALNDHFKLRGRGHAPSRQSQHHLDSCCPAPPSPRAALLFCLTPPSHPCRLLSVHCSVRNRSAGGAPEGDSMQQRRRDENSLRVTNLSEDVSEADLQVRSLLCMHLWIQIIQLISLAECCCASQHFAWCSLRLGRQVLPQACHGHCCTYSLLCALCTKPCSPFACFNISFLSMRTHPGHIPFIGAVPAFRPHQPRFPGSGSDNWREPRLRVCQLCLQGGCRARHPQPQRCVCVRACFARVRVR